MLAFTDNSTRQVTPPPRGNDERKVLRKEHFHLNAKACDPPPGGGSAPHMIRIKKKSIRNFFFLLAILLVLFVSAARPHNQPPRIELGGAVHIQCSPGCDYWDGHRWHCCGNGGGGPTNQPPTITATLLCAQNGTNGWCRSGAQLQLSASDPQGYTVSIIGDVGNGVEFTCGSSCIADLPEGSGTANYTATSPLPPISPLAAILPGITMLRLPPPR